MANKGKPHDGDVPNLSIPLPTANKKRQLHACGFFREVTRFEPKTKEFHDRFAVTIINSREAVRRETGRWWAFPPARPQ